MTSQNYPRRGEGDEVLLPRCPSCGRWAWPENHVCCPRCGGALEPAAARPTGEIVSVVLVHAGVLPAHLADGAYAIAMLRLDDGPTFVTRLSGGPDLPEPGMRSVLEWRTTPGGRLWPYATSTTHDAR